MALVIWLPLYRGVLLCVLREFFVFVENVISKVAEMFFSNTTDATASA
jgi:hypothetical protein